MRTFRSLSATPLAVLTFSMIHILCGLAEAIYDRFLSFNDEFKSFIILDIIFTCLITYLINSIISVFLANFVMDLILKGENREWLFSFSKILFTMFGTLLFGGSLVFGFYTNLELEKYFVQYILMITSFVIIPILFSARSL